MVIRDDEPSRKQLNELSRNCFKNFKQYNRWCGIEVLGVLPTAKMMPSVRSLPALAMAEIQRLVWLFTTNPISPIAERVREVEEGMKALAEEFGFESRDT
jgi:hypothetical protein